MILLTNATYYNKGVFKKGDIWIQGSCISQTGESCCCFDKVKTINTDNLLIITSFVDVHTHLREPGFFYKESIKSGTMAAAKSGYTTIFSMPNVNPCPDTLANLKIQQEIIDRDAKIEVLPYGTITKGQNGKVLSDMEELSSYVIAFSDDGKGVQNNSVMEKAMEKAKSLNKIIVAHCEDNTLLNGGYINEGKYSKEHNHKGIVSKSEYGQIARDIELVKKTGCKYHICHISTKESVELIRNAKKENLPITCETAPHYLTLCEDDLMEDGRFKMNPPLRTLEDKEALIEGLNDGTIDIIATDHAPHSIEEKNKGLKDSAFGIVGLETAFPILYTKLVLKNKVKLEKLIETMCINPRKIFGLNGGSIEKGQEASLCILDLNEKWQINSEKFLSKGKSTPFDMVNVYGQNKITIKN